MQGGMNILPRAGSPTPAPTPGPSDPDFSNVVFMFDGDGTNATNNNTFTDGSSNGYTVTENGTVIQGSFSPYSLPSGRAYTGTDGGSIYIGGNQNNYLSVSAGGFSTTATNYTIELWAYWESTDGAAILNGITSGNTDRLYLSMVSGTYYFGDGDTNNIIENVGLPSTNTWIHYAVVKNGSTTKLYIDGVEEASTTSALGTHTIATWQIGGRPNLGDYPFPGYLSDVRVVNGTAVYTGAFTPNTTPLTAITNTSLLIQGQNSAIFDLSGINNLDTVGNAQIDTAVVKYGTGSIEFDGTGDYLKTVENEALELGSGDWTIEFWIYFDAVNNGTVKYLFDWRTSSDTSNSFLAQESSNSWTYYNGAGASIGTGFTSSTFSASTWHHVAISKEGTTNRFFVDGTNTASSSDVSAYDSGTLVIGNRYAGAYFLNGYIDDFRVTKGLARYTSNFTAPTAALPKF